MLYTILTDFHFSGSSLFTLSQISIHDSSRLVNYAQARTESQRIIITWIQIDCQTSNLLSMTDLFSYLLPYSDSDPKLNFLVNLRVLLIVTVTALFGQFKNIIPRYQT